VTLFFFVFEWCATMTGWRCWGSLVLALVLPGTNADLFDSDNPETFRFELPGIWTSFPCSLVLPQGFPADGALVVGSRVVPPCDVSRSYIPTASLDIIGVTNPSAGSEAIEISALAPQFSLGGVARSFWTQYLYPSDAGFSPFQKAAAYNHSSTRCTVSNGDDDDSQISIASEMCELVSYVNSPPNFTIFWDPSVIFDGTNGNVLEYYNRSEIRHIASGEYSRFFVLIAFFT
jgi:hypothetical protein